MGIVVEILGRGRKPLETTVIDNASVTIGRAYDNNVIVHDPYVSAHHAVVSQTENGDFVIRGIGSENGLRDRKHRKIDNTVEFSSGEQFVLGKTRIRVLSSEHRVAPAVQLRLMDSFLRKLETPFIVILLALVLSISVLLQGYLQTFDEFRFSSHFNTVIALGVFSAAWALFWVMIARLAKHEGRFLQQLSITLLVSIISVATAAVLAWISFNLPGAFIQKLGEYVQWIILLFMLFWLNLYVALFLDTRKRALIASGLAAGIIGVMLVYEIFDQEDFSPGPVYSVEMLPPAMFAASGMSYQQFVDDSEKLFELLEKNSERDQ